MEFKVNCIHTGIGIDCFVNVIEVMLIYPYTLIHTYVRNKNKVSKYSLVYVTYDIQIFS